MEYKNYLEASLSDINACHAGYFSQDNSDSDEDIAKEVDVILNGKKKLLSLKMRMVVIIHFGFYFLNGLKRGLG